MTEKDPAAALIEGLCQAAQASEQAKAARPPLLSTPEKVRRSVMYREASAERARHLGLSPGVRGLPATPCHVCGFKGPKKAVKGVPYCRNCGSHTNKTLLIRENRRKAIQKAARERELSGKVRTADPYLSAQPDPVAFESGPIEQVAFNIDLGI